MGKLDAGDPAPDFTLPDQDGKAGLARRTSPAGRSWSTSTQGTTPRDARRRRASSTTTWRPSSKAKVPVLGISADTAAKHQKFREKYGLQFPLLTDADHAVGEAFGAWGEKTMYGKKTIGVIRSTFLIDADGTDRRAWYHVKADGHAAKVLEEIQG